jgi:glycosyltransferase involved in cell wall biosynthesis
MIACIVVDNGEPLLEQCLLSLRNQSLRAKIIVASGPRTNFSVAKRYADAVMPPESGIGKARVKAILNADAEYIISCDSDTIYGSNYVKYAVDSLQRHEFVRAGSIYPLQGSVLGYIESLAFTVPYEFALAFRKSSFLKYGFHLEDYIHPRADLYIPMVKKGIIPYLDFRMKCYTRLPTKFAVALAESHIPALLAGMTPFAFSVAAVLSNLK